MGHQALLQLSDAMPLAHLICPGGSLFIFSSGYWFNRESAKWRPGFLLPKNLLLLDLEAWPEMILKNNPNKINTIKVLSQ